MLLLVGCHTEDDDRPPICIPCDGQVHLVVYSNLTAEQLSGATISLCVNATSCAHTKVDEACNLDECVFIGGFAGTVSTRSSILTVAVPGAESHADGESWSIAITDASNTALFSSTASATNTVKPAACGIGTCTDLSVDLR